LGFQGEKDRGPCSVTVSVFNVRKATRLENGRQSEKRSHQKQKVEVEALEAEKNADK